MPHATEKRELLLAVYPDVRKWVDGFLVAKRAQGVAAGTLKKIYGPRLARFAAYCEKRNANTVEAVDANLLREYLLHLEEHGHNPGGVHQFYRVLKTFLRWYELEAEPENWRNPIRRVPPPKVPEEILEPVSVDVVARMLATCGSDRVGLRDRAILVALLDTGARASELTGFDLGDLDPVTGALTIRKGKGGKRRAVFLGHKARRAVRAYLRVRGSAPGALFATRSRTRMTYGGLRSMLQRRARKAGLRHPPSLHSFRRAFALEMLRAGVDVFALQRLMGHTTLTVLHRYLAQTTDDLQAAHRAASPGDRL